jgi:predicted nucleotidyltransferase
LKWWRATANINDMEPGPDAADAVVALRRRAGLTQQQLADLAGVAQPNIAAYEAGTRRPSAKMLERLRAAARPRPSVALAAHRNQVLALARRHRATEVKVFGSVARAEDRPGSDVDLLVRFAPEASLLDQAALAQDVEDLLGLHVDVVSEAGLRGEHRRIREEAVPL